MTDVTCPLCGDSLDRAPVIAERSRFDHPSRRVVCLGCSLVQVSPQPSEADLDAYYRQGYREEYEAHTTISVTDGHGGRRVYSPEDEDYSDALDITAEHQADKVLRMGLDEGARVLEVGCGRGRTMARLEAEGLELTGIEPGDDAVSTVDVMGDVFHGRWQDFPLQPGGFDAVVAFHVLEHVTNPLRFLAWCRAQLREGGKVLFEVPNVDTPNGPLEENYFQHVHLFDFSPHTLSALLHVAGFDRVTAGRHGAAAVVTATNGRSGRRPYEPHGGPSGEAVYLSLLSYRERNKPRPAVTDLADRFLRGEEGLDLDEVRREWREERAEAEDIRRCWTDLQHAIGQYAQQAERLGYAAFDVWTDDEQVNGQVWGEGYGWTRTAMLLTTIHEAMQRASGTYQSRRGR